MPTNQRLATYVALCAVIVMAVFVSKAWAFSPTAEPGQEGEPLYSGTVVQALPAGSYTYVLVAVSDSAQIWAATPRTVVNVGDVVDVPNGMPMVDFHSKTLDQDFELIYFVDQITNHSTVSATTAQPDTDSIQQTIQALAPIEGVIDLATVFTSKEALSQQPVKVQGVVVKFNEAIMGTNWIHIQDGTQNGNKNYDLTVTSDNSVSVGDVVTVEGILTIDKNVGGGYHFDVIIEGARVKQRD